MRAVNQRRTIIEVFDDYRIFEYLDADTYCVGCPICREPLRLTFRGQLVDLWCSAGCDEADVARAAFGLSEAT